MAPINPVTVKAPAEAKRWLRPNLSARAAWPTRPRLIAATAGPRTPPVSPCNTKAAKTTGRIGHSAITSALTATMMAPSARRNRLERLESSNSPPGSWLSKPAMPLTLSTYPMFCWLHFSSANSTATNGPNPACMPARKKLIPSRPFRLELEGDRSTASDAAVIDIVLASPSLGQSIGIVVGLPMPPARRVGHDRLFCEGAFIGSAAYRLDKEELPP